MAQQPSGTNSSSSSNLPTPTAASTPKPEPVVTLSDCYDTKYNDLPTITISHISSPEKEFSKIWHKKIEDCNKAKRSKGPLTSREQKALATSRYKAKDVGDIYMFCAENDSDDYYAKKSASVSAGQAAEIEGWLVICPHHPLAKAWKAAIGRGKKEIRLEKSGRQFSDGTYRVGKEIKPGRYQISGHIENCYWERQNRSGHIIDNYFTLAARRVEVTIRRADYAFSSKGCGVWSPS